MYPVIGCLLALLLLAGPAAAGGPGLEGLIFQIVRTAGEEVLWESPVQPGDFFTIDYRHSSDHTPVQDLFRIEEGGGIVLIEERYRWYGAGLESHPAVGSTDYSGDWTRVHLYRPLPRFLLRVGEVAKHVLTIHGQAVPLLSIARGRDSVWIRVKKSVTNR